MDSDEDLEVEVSPESLEAVKLDIEKAKLDLKKEEDRQEELLAK